MSMKSYAGIGSRDISEKEASLITKIANKLSKSYILYSGNADGSDVTFQRGADGNCVVWLPWWGFNFNIYDAPSLALDVYDMGKSKAGIESLSYHPRGDFLTYGARCMMARNYHQVMGDSQYPKVDFVVCCADASGNGVKGGTGQAVRIANAHGIPVYNIRNPLELNVLLNIIDKLGV